MIVPAFDEALRISATLASIPDYVDAIYVIDDASTDGTGAAAVATGDPRLELVRLAENQGVGAAIRTGYERALAGQADILVVMAGDGQMDPADLPALLEPLAAAKADYVKGNRFRHPARRRMPRLRRWAGKALATATRGATGLAIDDSQCGYTAMSAHAARSLPLRDLWPRYGYPNDLLGMLAAQGLRVAEVPVRPVYAGEASGVRPWHAFVVLYVIARRWVR